MLQRETAHFTQNAFEMMSDHWVAKERGSLAYSIARNLINYSTRFIFQLTPSPVSGEQKQRLRQAEQPSKCSARRAPCLQHHCKEPDLKGSHHQCPEHGSASTLQQHGAVTRQQNFVCRKCKTRRHSGVFCFSPHHLDTSHRVQRCALKG